MVLRRNRTVPRRNVAVTVHSASIRATAGMCASRALVEARCGGPLVVASEGAHRRPVGHGWRRWRRERSEVFRTVDWLAIDDGQHRLQMLDLVLSNLEIVAVKNGEVGELADFDVALVAFLVGEPGDILRPHPERGLAVKAVVARIELQPA